MDTHQSQSDHTYLLACPVCADAHGEPTSISLGHGQRTLHYRCVRCSHTWHETTTDHGAMFTGNAGWNETTGRAGPK